MGAIPKALRRSSNGTTAPSITLPTERCTTSRKPATLRKKPSLRPFAACGPLGRKPKFSTWIFAIAYHACCDRLNRRKHFASEELPDRADASPGPEHRVIALDEASRLRAAIDALPEKYRTVVTLFHLQGRQYEEIATVLGLPLGTVKTHLFRAKEQLRRLLSAMEVTES